MVVGSSMGWGWRGARGGSRGMGRGAAVAHFWGLEAKQEGGADRRKQGDGDVAGLSRRGTAAGVSGLGYRQWPAL